MSGTDWIRGIAFWRTFRPEPQWPLLLETRNLYVTPPHSSVGECYAWLSFQAQVLRIAIPYVCRYHCPCLIKINQLPSHPVISKTVWIHAWLYADMQWMDLLNRWLFSVRCLSEILQYFSGGFIKARLSWGEIKVLDVVITKHIQSHKLYSGPLQTLQKRNKVKKHLWTQITLEFNHSKTHNTKYITSTITV